MIRTLGLKVCHAVSTGLGHQHRTHAISRWVVRHCWSKEETLWMGVKYYLLVRKLDQLTNNSIWTANAPQPAELGILRAHYMPIYEINMAMKISQSVNHGDTARFVKHQLETSLETSVKFTDGMTLFEFSVFGLVVLN